MRHVPRKRFGQNFLVDAHYIQRIVDSLGLRPEDKVVEIGPGLGALTFPLASRLRHLHVVELDRDLVAHLTAELPPDKVSVHAADALKFDLGALGVDLRLVGNLPYNISSPLLFHFATYSECIRDITVMLQKEVVNRMVARAGTADYGRLSVMLQYRFELEKLFDVPPGAFRPAPQVVSALVRLVPRPREQLAARDEAMFARIVAAAFGQRRKMLRNTLAEFVSGNGLAALGVDATQRGEELEVADYVRIANACAATSAVGA